MNQELENTLVASYPTIYRSLQPRFSGASRFECDDGWYRIIHELSRKLEAVACTSELLAIEVREKLGSLRFLLWADATGAAESWLAEAARLSQQTCERCSQQAKLRGHKDDGYARCAKRVPRRWTTSSNDAGTTEPSPCN